MIIWSPNGWQVIIWINVDPVYWDTYASPSINELIPCVNSWKGATFWRKKYDHYNIWKTFYKNKCMKYSVFIYPGEWYRITTMTYIILWESLGFCMTSWATDIPQKKVVRNCPKLRSHRTCHVDAFLANLQYSCTFQQMELILKP